MYNLDGTQLGESKGTTLMLSRIPKWPHSSHIIHDYFKHKFYVIILQGVKPQKIHICKSTWTIINNTATNITNKEKTKEKMNNFRESELFYLLLFIIYINYLCINLCIELLFYLNIIVFLRLFW